MRIYLVLLFFSLSTSAQLVERVQAQVGEEMISFIDLKNFQKQVRSKVFSSPVFLKPMFKRSQLLNSKNRALDFMITRELLAQLAEKEKLPNVAPAEVEKKLRQLRGSSSHKNFSIRLRGAGLNLKTLREQLLTNLKIDLLLSQFVVSKITVSEQDIESYYFNQNGRSLFNSFEYEFISVQFTESKKSAVLKSLNQNTSGDLEEIAKSLGLEYKNLRLRGEEIQKQLKTELDKLSISQISPFLIIGDSYYILQLKWKHPLISPREQRKKQQIEQALYKKKLAEEIKKWIEEKKAGFSIIRHSL